MRFGSLNLLVQSSSLRRAGLALAMASLLLNSACAAKCAFGGCRSVWVHPGWTEGKFEEDLGECSKQANWKICMRLKGWSTEMGMRSDAQSNFPSD